MIFNWNIFKWTWLQRFIVVMLIVTYKVLMCNPYAQRVTETFSKHYSAKLNIFCWASFICLFVATLYCFGFYKLKVIKFLIGSWCCLGANIFFLLVGYVKDKRIPTIEFGLGVVCVLGTSLLIWLFSKSYRVIPKSELLKEEQQKSAKRAEIW